MCSREKGELTVNGWYTLINEWYLIYLYYSIFCLFFTLSYHFLDFVVTFTPWNAFISERARFVC
jgi:hypothetical protein